MTRTMTTSFAGRWQTVAMCLFAQLLTLGMVGCSESEIDTEPSSTPTVTAVPSTTPTVTPTPEEEAPHHEVHFGSDQPGGGSLAVHDLLPTFPVPFTECLGGTGENCAGGTLVYTGISPGLDQLDEDRPAESFYVLEDETPLTLNVVALDPGLSIRYGDILISTGESVVLGTTPDLHADFEWQITVPGATPQQPYNATLHLTTTSATYGESDEFVLSFVPAAPED